MLARFIAALLVFGARAIANLGPRSLRIGKTVAFFRWHDISELLKSDTEFLIEPVNKERIEAVSGPFILGMDRKPALIRQHKAIYRAIRSADFSRVPQVIQQHSTPLLGDGRNNGKIDIVSDFARPIAAQTAMAYFGVAGPSQSEFMKVIRDVFHETFLNLNGDEQIKSKGIAAGRELSDWTQTEIASRRKKPKPGDVLQGLLDASHNSQFSTEEVGWMVSGLIVGAVDTTATCVANIMMAALADRKLLTAMQENAEDINCLRGFCWEALRRRPHNPIVLRQARSDRTFADTRIRSQDRVVAVTMAAMQDVRVFPDPQKMKPDRPRQAYMHFGYGAHECAGRQINDVQIPMLIAALLRERPSKLVSVKYDGPFPDEVVLTFQGEKT